jgi:hypothetical protein
MITPILEKLILSGRAFYKTAVVGGNKTTVDIENDRFIIITGIHFLGYQSTTFNIGRDTITQLSIYGEKGFNHYMFANSRLATTEYWDNTAGAPRTGNIKTAISQPKIDCYILHTTSVGFSFLTSGSTLPTVGSNGVASGNNPAYATPLDYGKDGDGSPLNVDLSVNMNPALNCDLVPRYAGIGVGTLISRQIQLPAAAGTTPITNNNPYMCIANIDYVEVLGIPENIGF